MKQTARIEIITPAIANRMLLQNWVNRPASNHRIDLYAKSMASGNWQLNASNIRFAVSGRLLDGQKRLMACIKANVSFETWVTRGIPDEYIYSIDIVQPRTVSDMLAFDEEKNVKHLSAVINLIAEIFGGRCQRLAYSPQREILEDNPDIRDCVKSRRLKFFKVPSSVEHAAFFVAMRAYGLNWVNEWLLKLSKSEFDSAQAAFDLYMKKRLAPSRNEGCLHLTAVLVKAMKWSKTGRKLILAWNPDKEAFPQL